jgi:hypothetical protein
MLSGEVLDASGMTVTPLVGAAAAIDQREDSPDQSNV